MKTITITLKDDDLRAAIESEAKIIGVIEEDMIIQALQFWLAETELDCEERRELEAAWREYEEVGGVEAREFFDGLRAEEAQRAKGRETGGASDWVGV